MNRYERYKDSGIPWLGEVPEHWEVKKINHVIKKIGDTDHYMPETVDNGIPYLMTGDLQELVSQINFDNCKKVNFDEFVKLSKKIKTQRDDLILARYATIGTVSYVDIDDDFLVSYSCVTIKSNQIILNGLFLFYYFKSSIFLNGIEAITNTNTQGNVGIDDLKKLKFALPPLSEQTAIAHYLDTKLGEIDVLIDKQQTLLEKLAEQRTAVITHAVTKGLNPAAPMKNSGVEWLGDVPAHWEMKAIKRVVKEHAGNGFPIELQGNNGDIAFLKVSDLNKSGKLLIDFANSVTENIIHEMKWNIVPKFSLVTAKIGEALKKNHRKIISQDSVIDNNCIAFECLGINLNYHYYLSLIIDFDWFENGGTVPSLSVQKYKNQKICIPPEEEQITIADYLDQETAKIDRLCETVNQTIGRLKEYRTA
uniref:restriction endonuclease subunit S n=1 Tax=uncultured Neisseria sp. TaxID=237778 RepID=UPI0025F1C00F